MAASDARNPLSVTTPNQISKDMHGPDSAIPLSPQWLLPKPGDNKAGFTPGENHVIPSTGYGDRIDVIKSPGNGEEKHESHKKKDVFRPAFLDMDSSRRDRWRDEERDTNSSIRRDRWRELDKEVGDNRKTDRWVDNSSVRHFGEARRGSADRWADPNRDANYDQRRESKWNTRWGPDGKEMDKWTDAGKHGDMPYDKGSLHLANHGKDEREGDSYRPWRPSSLQNRGRSEPQHQQTQMPSKEGPTFGHGRGRGENAPTFPGGRGRSSFGAGSVINNSSHSQSLSFIPDRGDNGHEEPSPFRYSRTKLLDVYRLTDVRSSNKILDGLLQVSSLTQEEPLEPLALCGPMPEELAILKGIDKGDIVSSGAPQISKEGAAGRSSVDFPQPRRTKLVGGRDDVSLPADDPNDRADNSKGAYSKFLEGMPHEKHLGANRSNVTMESMENHDVYAANKYSVEATGDDVALNKLNDNNKDSNNKGSVPGHSGIPWRSPSRAEHVHPPSRDWFDVPSDIRTRNSDVGWLQGLKDVSNERKNDLPDPSRANSEHQWQISEGSLIGKHPSMVVDREHESRKLMQPAPEDLLLYYKDPQGQIQGPFSGSDIIVWFEAGYFGIDLQVRLAHAPNDSPFSLLGDVMPHLRAKARPPPGFNTAKQTELTEASSRSSLSGIGKVLPGPSGIDLSGNERRLAHGSSTEAENRFLESLMSGDISSSPLERFTSSEALQGFIGLTSSGMPPLGAESGDALNLLAKRMNLERQKSVPHPYPYWPVRETAPLVPGPDISRDSSILQPNLLSSIADVPRQSHPQNVEVMSILQGLAERSSTGMNSGVGAWPNLSVQGGLDPFKDKIDLHHGQNTAQAIYGMQHQLQPQNQPSVSSLLTQTLDSPSVLTDRLLASGLAQDPQVLNLLQQQYLLQMQSQQSMAVPQLSLLDKMLLLKQQQKQEEQQQLLRQQQLLSKVLSEQHLVQRFADPSYAQLQASAIPVGNDPSDHSMPQLSHQLFQVSTQAPVSGMPDDRNVNCSNMPLKVPQSLNDAVASEGSSLQLPHQIFEDQNTWPAMPTHNDSDKHLSGSVMMENTAVSEALEKSQVASVLDNSTSYGLNAEASAGEASENTSNVLEPALVGVQESSGDPLPSDLPESVHKSSSVQEEILIPEGANDLKVTSPDTLEATPVKACNDNVLAAKEVKMVESREAKKTSEKKSRKSKSSKGQPSSDQAKGASKTSSLPSKPSEAEKSEVSVASGVTSGGMSKEKSRDVPRLREVESVPPSVPDGDFELESKVEQKQSDCVSSAQRAWKPAISVMPKSLLEIQQEEQRRMQTETPVSGISSSISSVSLSNPWAGGVVHSEPKLSKDIRQNSGNSESKMGESELPKSRKSGLHDLLAQEVLAKSNEREVEISEIAATLPPLPTVSTQMDTVDDDNFIEAKDTRKGRKKAAKAKGAGAKASSLVSSADVTVASSPIEKVKVSKHVQAEKEVRPAPPSGPSLGDFVLWKGESTSPSPAPAWSTDSVKVPKPTSLRDILREQEKKVTSTQHHPQTLTPQKPQSAQTQTRAGLWSVSASSPSKASSTIQIHSNASSQSKSKGEEDLFWGPPDQSKQETKQLDFPQLGNNGGWTTKSTPAKGASAASLNRQKSTGGRSLEHSFSSSHASVQSSVKGKGDASTKHSEAMDFRDWCESQSVRLTGSKDTSFLEFCLQQSRSEAEILLIENLGSFDPNHEFIENFLNYMELLPADVIEIAFQSRNDPKASNRGARDMISDNAGLGDYDMDNGAHADGSAKGGGGKKKGKKGKKVSPSVLGFNVISNRIMMGEIQNVED